MAIRKGWKITWITLGSLLGVIVLTVTVALWLIFTPSKLTKIVNGLAGDFILCESHFGNVELTLLSTFPDAGLKIEDVVLVTPMEGTNDTVAHIGSLTVGIDIMAFLKENKVEVHQVILDDATANLYINHNGEANFDVFPKSDSADTSALKIPELIDIEKVKISNLNACLNDERDSVRADVSRLDITLKGKMDGQDIDGKLNLDAQRIICAMRNMNADLGELSIDAKGSKEGDAIDAILSLDGKTLNFSMKDSTGVSSLQTLLSDFSLSLKGKGDLAQVVGDLKLNVEKGTFRNGKDEMVNEKLLASKNDLINIELPNFTYKIDKSELRLDCSRVKLDDYALNLVGQLFLATENRPLSMDMNIVTDGDWQVAPLLDIIPEQYTSFCKGMDIDGKLAFNITAVGSLTDSTMPGVGGTLWIDKGSFYAPSMLPYNINKIKGELGADINFDGKRASYAEIKNLKLHTRGTDISLSGRADDLLGDMRVDAKVKGTLPLEDIKPLIPKKIIFDARGDADLDFHTAFRMSHLTKRALDKVTAAGTLKVKNLDVNYDSLHASTPTFNLALNMPASKHKGKMANVSISGGDIAFSMKDNIKAKVEKPDINVWVNNLMQSQLVASFDIKVGETEATLDSTIVSLGELKLKGSVQLDSTQTNPLLQYNPVLEASTHSAVLYTSQLPDAVRLSELDLDYKPNHCYLKSCQVKLGHSDFELYGTVDNLEEWISHKAMLKGDLNFTSSYADVDQLMELLSGMGSDPDTLAAMRVEDSTPADAHPFIVPKDIDVTLNTHIKRSVAFGNDLNDVAGSLTVKDGVAVLDQMGFVCKAATMQLTAYYRSPRPSNLFTAIDFHLLDIQIDELISMIPCIDTLVPMLSAFDGNANFHLAGETYLNERYQPKLSSIMGAAAISGENLVVMDNSDISTIAKLMRFKKWSEKDNKIRIDSLSVEMTCMDAGFGTEVEILPFLLNVGSYKICISGVQNLDNSCAYHLELLKNPLLAKIGVDVKGTLMNPQISLGKVLYADLFRPTKQGVAEKKSLEIKSRVRQALEKNVR